MYRIVYSEINIRVHNAPEIRVLSSQKVLNPATRIRPRFQFDQFRLLV